MTPIHLNHPTSTIPILEYKEDHSLQLLSSTQTINRPTPPSTSSFLNLHAHEHPHTIEPIQALAKEEKFMFHGEGENPRGTMPSLWSEQSVKDGNESSQNSSYNIMRAEEMIKPSKESSSSRKHSSNWRSATHPKMGSSKHPVEFKPRVRIVHKFQDRGGNKSKNNAVRECSDCHTTTTPLWRSGPQGPKTLCNACGIRQRKARRAMEAAAAVARSNNNAAVSRANERGSMDASHLLPYKKRGKLLNIGSASTGTTTATSGFYETKKAAASLDDDSSSSASCLSKESDSQQRAFPSDEEEAAVLLMALSCGLA